LYYFVLRHVVVLCPSRLKLFFQLVPKLRRLCQTESVRGIIAPDNIPHGTAQPQTKRNNWRQAKGYRFAMQIFNATMRPNIKVRLTPIAYYDIIRLLKS